MAVSQVAVNCDIHARVEQIKKTGTTPPGSLIEFSYPEPSSLSAEKLANELYSDFEKFADRKEGGLYITRDSLHRVAYADVKPGPAVWRSLVALEILKRPELMNRLDRGQNGKLDNKIDRENVRKVKDADEYPNSNRDMPPSAKVTATNVAAQNSPLPPAAFARLNAPVVRPLEDDPVMPLRTASDLTVLQMSKNLYLSFDRLADPHLHSYFVTRESLQRVVNAKGSGGESLESLLAAELLRRPALFERLSKHDFGEPTGQIGRSDILNLIKGHEHGGNQFRSDRELSKQLQAGFEELADANDKRFVTRNSLLKASRGIDGVSTKHSVLATEILRRPLLMNQLDADSWGRLDGVINKNNIDNFVTKDRSTPYRAWTDEQLLLKLHSSFIEFPPQYLNDQVGWESLKNAASSNGSEAERQAKISFLEELYSRDSINLSPSANKYVGVYFTRIIEKLSDRQEVNETPNGGRVVTHYTRDGKALGQLHYERHVGHFATTLKLIEVRRPEA